jgi:DNA polymerase-3 subunit delta
MKLEPRRIEGFLDAPGACRAVLLFGDDTGMIRERANRLVKAVAGGLDDPFRVADLEREGLPRLAEELSSRALTGGRRVVRIRDVTDGATTAVMAALERGGEALLVLEGPGLVSRSKLRAALERAPDMVAIGCYPLEGGSLEQAITSLLAGHGVSVTPEARTWLAGQLGADQAVTRSELEKLALYVGQGGQVDLAAAEQCVGDLAGLSLDDALFAATAGDLAETDRALELAMAEGTAPVGMLRATLGHLQRLQRARAAMAQGASASEAAKAARPPVFFKREPAFTQALRLWPEPALEAAAQRVWEAERACKRTGSPAESLCRSVLLGLAQRAAQQRRR